MRQNYQDLKDRKQQPNKGNKKCLIGGTLGLLALGGIFSVIMLTNKQDGSGQQDPTRDLIYGLQTENDPLKYQEYNPFVIDEATPVESQDWYYNGVLKNRQEMPEGEEPTKMRKLTTEEFLKEQGQVYSKLQPSGQDGDGLTYKPIDPKRIVTGPNNMMPSQVNFNFSLLSNYEARVQLTNRKGQNFSVSDHTYHRTVQEFEARFTQLGFNLSKPGEPFHWSLTNIFNGEQVLTTKNRKFLIQEKFSEIGMVLPNNRIFGLGMSNRQFKVDTDATYTLWSKGRKNDPMAKDEGLGGSQGSQVLPFILGQTENKQDWYGIFFVGSTASSVELIKVANSSNVILNYITLGDQIEFYVTMRGSAKFILQKYQHAIGYPSLPPYYALGIFTGSQVDPQWHNTYKIQEKVFNYAQANMSIEGVVIDQYTSYDFCPYQVADEFNLTDVQEFLKGKSMKMYLSIQAGMHDGMNVCEAYKLASKHGCLMTQQGSNKTQVGIGQPFSSTGDKDLYPMALIDVFHDNAKDCMQDLFENLMPLNGMIEPDGFYLRDNSPYTYSNGSNLDIEKLKSNDGQNQEEAKGQTNKDPEDFGNYEGYKLAKNQNKVDFNNLPFTPGFDHGGNMYDHTIDNNIMHQGFANTTPSHKEGVPHLYTHNHYGLTQHNLTYNYLRTFNDKRPNIYSSSVWSSSGKIGGSFAQPMEISYASVINSISQAMVAGLNGINHWVTDVCGVDMDDMRVLNKTEVEICARWMELSAFLPMVSVKGRLLDLIIEDQTGEYGTFIEAMNQRLPFTRYIYSQMFSANYTGGQLVYPLLYDYPEDDNCLDNIEYTYMLGDAIKVSPDMAPKNQFNNETFEAYFPQGVWRDLNDWTGTINASAGGDYFNISRTPGKTQIHLKQGKIIPWQPVPPGSRVLTSDLMKQPTMLIINVDDSNYAEGYMMVDDGSSQVSFANNNYTFWKFRYGEKALNFWVERGNFSYDVTYDQQDALFHQLEKVVILGAKEQFPNIEKGKYAACSFGLKLNPEKMNIEYDSDSDSLEITPTVRRTFNDLGFIKFLDTETESNVCDSSGFQYNAELDTSLSTPQMQVYNLEPPTNMAYNKLTAVFTLMSDDGTINFNMTTNEDFVSGYKKIFRAWHVQDYSQYYDLTKVTEKIDKYIEVQLSPFSFKIKDEAGNAIYTSEENKLYMTEYLVFDSAVFPLNALNDNPLMGMGERAGDLFYKNEDGGVHSRWAHDAANPIDDGLPPGRNMYGIQPFYIYQSDNRKWYGVFNNNPYATDYIITTPKSKEVDGVMTQSSATITTVTIGGAIEKYFFAGAKVDDVIIKYERLTGMPMMPPLWSFGWQQCRFGWVTDQKWQHVVDEYDRFKIPLDTMWADIDYMDDYKIFTISPSRYSNLTKQVEYIRKEKNMTFVPIMDAGVAVRKNIDEYPTLKTGLDRQIFIKQAESDDPLTAGVWCGNAYFPDFYKADTNAWWGEQFDLLHKTVGLELDGIWLDMNEATVFCDGYCIDSERPKNSLRNKPYYVPGQRDLETQNLGVDGRHDNSTVQHRIAEYDAHNTFSIMQTKATHDWLIKQGLRPYVLSRSNFQGLQKYAYHWLGDNWSWVEYMVASVKNIYEYQLFGLPFMGCDLCGFNGDAVGDLCARWHQVGTLFPFARNHNQNASSDQEPYQFNFTLFANVSDRHDLTYTDLIRTAIQNRYTFIRYYYSQFWQINEYGGSFFKPLFFEFGDDPEAYKLIEKNMLLGNALKASVETTNLTKQDAVDFYFPQGTWCQLIPSMTQSFSDCVNQEVKGGNVTLRSHLEDYYIHLRNGYIVPLQNATLHNTMKTKEQLDQHMDLYILPNASNFKSQKILNTTVDAAATGFIYFDDGVSYQKNVTTYEMWYTYPGKGTGAEENSATIHFSQSGGGYTHPNNAAQEQIGTITIFNPMQDPSGPNSTDRVRQVDHVSAYIKEDKTHILIKLPFSYENNDPASQIVHINVSNGDTPAEHYPFARMHNITVSYK